MFEAKLAKANTLKKIIEAIKELITDAPFDCSEGAMCLQVGWLVDDHCHHDVDAKPQNTISTGHGLVACGVGVVEDGRRLV